jgi:hypothetical protein
MPSSFASRTGHTLSRTPSYRHQAMRRRLGIACAIIALAIAAGVLGSLIRPAAPPQPSHADTGPFSYFPSQ